MMWETWYLRGNFSCVQSLCVHTQAADKRSDVYEMSHDIGMPSAMADRFTPFQTQNLQHHGIIEPSEPASAEKCVAERRRPTMKVCIDRIILEVQLQFSSCVFMMLRRAIPILLCLPHCSNTSDYSLTL